jgi:hypothetical protein
LTITKGLKIIAKINNKKKILLGLAKRRILSILLEKRDG